jgi:hypothetical protein
MERTFKHKKTGEIATYKDGIFKQGRFTVEIGVEPSSEYWEEILSKDYEILSFRSKELSYYIPRIQKDGTYLDCPINSEKGSGASLEWMLNEREYYIESVKRLSDGEVFHLGDICFPTSTPSNKLPISEIWFTQSGDLRLSSDNYTMSIGGLTKYEEPKVLFKTLDGQEMKFGDKFYVVDTKYFKIFEAEAGITFKTEKWIKNSYADKKFAEEWILNNKPVLSLNDLLSVWGAMENKDFYAISPLFKNFKEIAENKIKENERL